MRELARKDNEFLWNDEAQSEFIKIKKDLQLHEFRSSQDQMFRIAKQTLYWPTLKMDLLNILSHAQYAPPVLYPIFANHHPMDALSMDYAAFRGKHLLVVADRGSGFLFATFCKDQTSRTAITFLHQLAARYGYPSSVRTDNGPSFRGSFSVEL